MSIPVDGVYTASLTPLTSRLEPNIPALIDHVLWLLGSGSDGVALLGSTGEANSMTLNQRIRIIKKIGNKLPHKKIIIGTGSCALKDAVKLTKASIDSGFFSVLVLPPFYYKPQTDESVFQYFSKLISIVDNPKLRIIFYNFPKLTGYNFSIKILKDLKKHFGEIATGIKDSSSEWTNILQLVNNISDFKIFAGTETFLLDTLKIGGSGCISASANLTAKKCQQVYQAWGSKKIKEAKKNQNTLSSFRKVLENYSFVPELKCLFASQTNDGNWVNMLPPFYPIPNNQVYSIVKQLKEVGLNLDQYLGKN